MVLLIHILIALSSIFYTTYLFFAPSRGKLYVSYGLVAATVASGTYLVVSTHARLVSACETGLFYLGIVTIAIIGVHYRLAVERKRVTEPIRRQNY